MATIRPIIPAKREEPKEKRYFHSDYERSGLAFYRDGKFVFDELYQEPRVTISRSERIRTNQEAQPVVSMRSDIPEEPAVVIKTRNRRDGLPNPGRAQLARDYIGNRMSIYAMSKKYGRSAATIRIWLELEQVATRDQTVGA